MPKKLTTEEFIERAQKVHRDKYNYSKVEYISSQVKVCIICPKHGEFWQKPNNHLNGEECPHCSHRSFRYTNQEFIEKAKVVHGDKYDYSKTDMNNRDENGRICIICPKHGEFWQNVTSHLCGKGCKKCGYHSQSLKKRWDKNMFIEQAKKLYGNKYDYSKVNYVNAKTNVYIICNKHGEFLQTPDGHLKGHECPKCSTSKLENKLIKFFDDNKLNYIHRCNKQIFSWLLKQHLDFYLPEYNVAVECQGEQHYRPANFGSKVKSKEDCFNKVKKRDLNKKIICEEHDVKLLYFSDKQYEDDIITDENKLLEEILKE